MLLVTVSFLSTHFQISTWQFVFLFFFVYLYTSLSLHI